jgi:hypothetical protein
MFAVVFTCTLLIAFTTLLHYEALQQLHRRLVSASMPSRPKVLVVMFGAFVAHAAEVALYGLAYYVLLSHVGAGTLMGIQDGHRTRSLLECMYFSGATYTSLGLGDLAPTGPIRLLAAAQALHGLLLIGWTASFLYIAMERFWNARHPH